MMQTTIYYDAQKMTDNYRRIQQLIPGWTVYYALKSNADDALLKILHRAGAAFEVASLEEFLKVQKLGVSADKIITSLPVKPPALIEAMDAYGCSYFVFDRLEEYDKIKKLAPQAKKILRIYVHDIDPVSIRYGVTMDEFIEMCARRPGLEADIDGITYHFSRNYRRALIEPAFARLRQFMEHFKDRQDFVVNLGGDYRLHLQTAPGGENEDLDANYRLLREQIASLRRDYSVQIWAEPGRSVVDNTGRITTPVELVTTRFGRDEVYINFNVGKLSDGFPFKVNLCKPDGRKYPLYDAVDGTLNGAETREVDIMDTVCTHKNLYTLPFVAGTIIEEGDLLEFEGMGAYTTCFSRNFHARNYIEAVIE